jgi:acetyl esterase/lipase
MAPRNLLLPAIVCCFAASVCVFADQGQAPQVVPLWKNGAPGFESRKDEKENVTFNKNGQETGVKNVHNPSITVYLPAKEKATGAAVVICPGGGHSNLGIGGEGHAVAKWFVDNGVAGFVLKYRLEREKGSPYKIAVHALQDGQRAIRTIRHNAKEWGVEPSRVGIMGFSAGGEVVGYACTKFDKGNPDAEDPIERQGCRPDFQILIYSGPLGIKGATLTKDVPPAFIAIGEKDNQAVTMANHFVALKKAGVSAELHMYANTDHAFGMGTSAKLTSSAQGWTNRLKEWMNDRGFTKGTNRSGPESWTPAGLASLQGSRWGWQPTS